MKSVLKKVWNFFWEEDSVLSWCLNVFVAFVVIKFILYPGLGWILGTPAPIVAVVSGSMEHESTIDKFWDEPMCCTSDCSIQLIQGTYYERLNISKREFRSFDFVNGFNKGDIMVLASPNTAGVGDVIVYVVPNRPDPIIHRVIAKEGDLFWTKGDHNCDVGEFEKGIPSKRVIGKAVWRVPFLGWVKIIAVDAWNTIVG